MVSAIFIFWLLLLPTSWVFSAYLPVIAPGKMLAPLLLLAGSVGVLRSPLGRVREVVVLGLLAAAFILLKHLSFMGDGTVYSGLLWNDAILLGYFMVPVVCIRNLRQFRQAAWAIVWVAVAGCVSAFLVSMGLLTLPLERFEASRLGIESLRKAIGLFPSYGDLAQYLAFAVLWVVALPRHERRPVRWGALMRALVAVSVILGLLGTQSRSVLLSLVLALAAWWMIARISRFGRQPGVGVVFGVGGGVLALVGLVVVFAGNLIDVLSHMGGATAAHTAMDRLQQYKVAWDIISASPLLGADLSTYEQMSGLIEHIHNMWLRIMAHGGMVALMALLVLLSRIVLGVFAAHRIQAKAQYARVAMGYLVAVLVSVEFYVGMGEMFWALLGVVASLGCIPPFTESSREKSGQAQRGRECTEEPYRPLRAPKGMSRLS